MRVLANTKHAFLFAWLLLTPPVLLADAVLLDHIENCGQLKCFKSATDPLRYFYLPSIPRVATKADGKPEFSFTRYVEQEPMNGNGRGGIVDADGGGIVHFLVDYSVPDELLQGAEMALRDIDEEATLVGPIMFEGGSFALVSSFAADEEKPNDLSRTIVGVGKAPLVEGLKSAVSMHLSKKGAQILWRSFQMATPDVSVVFEMQFAGLRDPHEATITADWSKLQQQADKSFGADLGYMGIGGGFDFQDFWSEASNSGGIDIEYLGDPSKLQTVIERAHTRLHQLMFEPIPVQANTASEESSVTETASAILGAVGGAASVSQSPWEFKIKGGYKRRRLSQTGKYTFTFKQQDRDVINTVFAGNLADLYQNFGDDPSVFRTFSLTDQEFRVREISVAVDARDESEFSKYINNVSVSIEKNHGSGQSTAGELVINRNTFKQGKPLRFNYGWDGERDLNAWKQYRYRVTWSFIGGSEVRSDWIDSDRPAIVLTPPYQYKQIEFLSSPEILAEQNVRMVSVRVKHKFYGRNVSENINLIPNRDTFNASRVYAVEPGQDQLEYIITWTFKDHTRISSGPMTSNDSIIFCDEVSRHKSSSS